MKKAPRKKVAGVGTAMGAVIFGSLLFACAPGALPCDKDDEWKGICKGVDDGGITPSGTGGSNNQTGGNSGSGGAGGGMGGNNGGAPNAETPVADCSKWSTVGAMDMFFANKCGSGGALCHAAKAVWGDFLAPEFYKRGPTIKTVLGCIGTPLVDTTDHTKSAIFMKINGDTKCGTKMPPEAAMAMQKIDESEKTCIINYLKALVPAK